jgi:DNA-binding MarR family transcriptional regulator
MVYRMNMSSDQLRPTSAPTVGSMLRMAWEQLIGEVWAGLDAAGFDNVRSVHAPILRNLLVEGLRPSELAVKLGLSRQAVNDLLREFEANGYIRLEPDDEDRRAKRITLTERGWDLGETAAELSRAVGRRWSEQVGAERYAVFEGVLAEIVREQVVRFSGRRVVVRTTL